MVRAGVFIGVDRTGGLEPLNDAAAGARRMYDWALAQGMDPSMAHLVTDAGGDRVTPDMVYDAIESIVAGAGADQLILYFAGHGVNINRGEQWLLTGAPTNASAAVNVAGNVELARYCGIQHVVMISDACRVAPEGIRAQNVRGSDVFPNDPTGDRAKPVDQFFACFLGRTAAELRDPAEAASTFSALYTGALLDALSGRSAEVLEPATEPADPRRYVRPRTLQRWLEAEVPRRVRELNLQNRVNQNPDAIITSDGSWLSCLEPTPLESTPGPTPAPSPPPSPPDATLQQLSRTLVHSATAGGQAALGRQLQALRDTLAPGAETLARTVEQMAKPFGPDHFETTCGIKVRGKRVVDFFAPRVRAELLGTGGDLLRVLDLDRPAASVLLRFEGDVGTVVPVLNGFLAALTFEDDELVDVAYEPSANTDRWHRSRPLMDEMRALRTVAASASQHGRFRLEGEDADRLARRMQELKGVDPTLAVYAAYAYHDLQLVERIREMSAYLQGDVGVTWFDLALLGRKLVGEAVRPEDRIVPFVPLLAQGWALLRAHRVRLHPALRDLQDSLRDSLWSLYDAAGVDRLREAMQTMEVR